MAFTEVLAVQNDLFIVRARSRIYLGNPERQVLGCRGESRNRCDNKKIILDSRYFGEGMTVLNNKLYYLTWQTKMGFVYDARTYKQMGEFTFETEGWGLTHDNKDLIMSAGTDKLYFLDTVHLKVILPFLLGKATRQ